jgi:hypothetical protein
MGYDAIFAELLLTATLRWAVRAAGGDPDNRRMHELIDELGARLLREKGAIDGEGMLLAALRRAARAYGGHVPASARIDQLLDERMRSSRTSLFPHSDPAAEHARHDARGMNGSRQPANR